jgi:hypothetical protein
MLADLIENIVGNCKKMPKVLPCRMAKAYAAPKEPQKSIKINNLRRIEPLSLGVLGPMFYHRAKNVSPILVLLRP